MKLILMLRSGFHSLENGLLVALVLGMLCLSVSQIFLRNLFDFGIVWAETLIRLMVLWTAMIGSMIAARASQHISIDLVKRFGKGKLKDFTLGLVHALTAAVCLLLAYYSMQLLILEFNDETYAFADIPNWAFISIIPVAFLIMGIRYLSDAILHFLKIE